MLTFSLIVLVLISVAALLIIDILHTGKYASKNTKMLWLLLVIIAPFTGYGLAVWIAYPFLGHKALKRESLLTLEGDASQLPQIPKNTDSKITIVGNSQFEYHESVETSSRELNYKPTQSVTGYNLQTVKKFKNTTSIMGAILSILMITSGLVIVGTVLIIALLFYQCSQPGAKCM